MSANLFILEGDSAYPHPISSLTPIGPISSLTPTGPNPHTGWLPEDPVVSIKVLFPEDGLDTGFKPLKVNYVYCSDQMKIISTTPVKIAPLTKDHLLQALRMLVPINVNNKIKTITFQVSA